MPEKREIALPDAVLAPWPLAIGVGFELSAIETIYPQAFDIPMDLIVTEAALRRR